MKGEQEFNRVLGEALRKTRPSWKNTVFVEETRLLSESKGLRVDILIAGQDAPPVVIETSFVAGDADKDAVARLGRHYAKNGDEIKTAISVELEVGHRQIKRLGGRHLLKYAVHQKTSDEDIRRFPPEGFMVGTYADIARLAASTSVPKEDVERAATDVASLVKEAANILDGAVRDEHLRDMSRILYQRSALSGLQTTCVLWLNALLVHKALYGGHPNIPKPSRIPDECADAWRQIHAINWRAIFEPAIQILDNLLVTAPGPVTKSFKRLHKAAGIIEAAKIGSEINIGAELFPNLTSDKKQSAAFYTQPSTAEFLAAMTIRKDMADWSRPDVFKNFKIADLSCGTGTLLRFGYRQVRLYHGDAGCTARSLDILHTGAMEAGLYGTDISPIASHLTSTSLAMTSRQSYGKTNIGWVGVGNKNRTGSIEYIKYTSIQDLFSEGFGRSTGSDYSDQSVVVKDSDISVALMNPPYSRTRGGQSAFDLDGLDDDERTACQDRWGELIKGEDCDKRAGMAATFVCIARKKVKPEGRIGFVLPRTAAFAHTWRKTRNMVETWFEDIVAVAVSPGKALGKNALSADAMMEEMMLVATKREKQSDVHSPVRCVTLHEPVLRIGEAAEIAKAVMSGPKVGSITLGGVEIGVSHMFKTGTGGGGGPWSAVGSVGDTLEMIKNGLVKGQLLSAEGDHVSSIPMTTIGVMFDIGPTHHLIGHLDGKEAIGAFKFTPVTGYVDSVGKYRSLWASDAKSQKSLVVTPTHKGTVYDDTKSVEIWKRRTTLFYQKNMTWSSQSMVATMTRQNVLGGSAWLGLRHSDDRVMKAFTLWANSIFGMIVYWANGQRSQQDARSRMQIGAVGGVQCPDFAKLGDELLDMVAAYFDKMAGTSAVQHVRTVRAAAGGGGVEKQKA